MIYYNGVELSLETGDKMTSGSKKGRIYLTTTRVIFVNSKTNDNIVSLSIPFHCLKEVDVEQPVFGANYMKGRVVAEQGGGLPNTGGKFKFYFSHGGAIEFTQSLMKAAQMASGHAQVPAVFVRPDATVILAPPPAYTPQQQYNFVSPIFNDRPPTNDVYTYEAPPPYPSAVPIQRPSGQNPQAPAQAGWNVQPPNLPSYDDYVKTKKD